jgi:coenzyme PQQ precursor peptide PqqA
VGWLNNDIQAIASQDFMESIMAWTTPILVEICIGLEINGYLPAEFWSAIQPFAMPVRRPLSCSLLRQAVCHNAVLFMTTREYASRDEMSRRLLSSQRIMRT